MIQKATRWSDWQAALSAVCDRFLPAAPASARDVSRARRLVAAALAGPLLIVLSLSVSIAAEWLMAMLATAMAVLAVGWSLVLAVALGAGERRTEPAALLLATFAVALAVAAGGGLASPAALLLLALPIEAFWVTRKLRAVAWAGAAVAVAIPVQALLSGTTGLAGVPSAWHWAAPLAYGATIILRAGAFEAERAARPTGLAGQALPGRMWAAVFRLSPTGQVDETSPRAGQVLGIEPELLYGSGLAERLRVSDRVAFRRALDGVARGRETAPFEAWLRLPVVGKDGRPTSSYRPFEFELIGGEDGEAGAIAIIRPRDELESLRAELEHAREVADSTEVAKARFLASVSHELRTPLNAIIGFSELMLHEAISGPLQAKQREHVGLIRDAGRHLLSVVNAILDVSRIESGAYRLHPEPFCLKTSVALCCSMLEPQAREKGLRVTTNVTASGDICCDQRAVQQIIINLLSNAIKFTPEGGAVTVTAAPDETHLLIEVSDTGIGIEEGDLDRIGKPFTQFQNGYARQNDGAGLGLCLVRGLVELHDGSMSIESAPGEGTTVTIRLPLEPAVEGLDTEEEPGAVGEVTNELDGACDEAIRRIA